VLRYAPAVTPPPSIARLQHAVDEFGAYLGPEKSWLAFTTATAPAVDFTRAAHRKAAHAWLNAWTCRIRYPRPGEPDVFGVGLSAWWRQWRTSLPPLDVSVSELTDEQVEAAGASFAALAVSPAAQTKTMRAFGPTAASKLLYALRPKALLPWDEMIATTLHGARDSEAYVAHLRLARAWAQTLLTESGLDEDALCVRLGRPGRTLAKLLDEYCYIVYTRDAVK
jgi:hypothetical protein